MTEALIEMAAVYALKMHHRLWPVLNFEDTSYSFIFVVVLFFSASAWFRVYARWSTSTNTFENMRLLQLAVCSFIYIYLYSDKSSRALNLQSMALGRKFGIPIF